MEPVDSQEDIIINEWDGLSLDDVTQNDSQANVPAASEESHDFATSHTAAPNRIIIVTNVIEAVFTSSDAKAQFEDLFLKHDPEAQFHYLKCFRRARVVFSSVENAKEAHASLNNSQLLGQPFRCYFAQPISLSKDFAGNRQHLEPPPPDKQFLISPPASPPVGWEVINERRPAINYDLIAAMDKLGPGESYELHTGNNNQPSIVVHVCEDPAGYEKRPPKIPQTRCPDRKP